MRKKAAVTDGVCVRTSRSGMPVSARIRGSDWRSLMSHITRSESDVYPAISSQSVAMMMAATPLIAAGKGGGPNQRRRAVSEKS